MKAHTDIIRNEVASESVSINAKRIEADLTGKHVNSFKNISRAERKKEASKPFYLTRYE